MSSYQPRRDQSQPTYASATTSAATATTTMYAPIAERAIPYEQYMSRDGELVYSASRVTPRNAPTPSRAATDDAASTDLRQISREPNVISVTSTVDGDVRTSSASARSRSTTAGDKPRTSAVEGARITAGFDSNTLKRMLQTLPELSSPVDMMQEFEEEFADVVGPSAATPDDAKPVSIPPPLPPADDDVQTATRATVTAARTASDRPVDVSPAAGHADVTTSSAEVVTSDISHERPEAAQNDDADLRNNEHVAVAAAVQLADVPLTSITSSGKFHAPLVVLSSVTVY